MEKKQFEQAIQTSPNIVGQILSVTVVSPNGGEQFQAGQQVTIQWQSVGATNQRVQYSLDGVNLTPIITGLAGSVQSTIWTIPANIVPAGQMQVTAVVRVISRNENTGDEVMDSSNGLFTIRSSTPAPTLSVTVLSPNGGEQFQAGQQVTINWQSTGATNQRVQYSLNGVTFTPIVTGLAGNVQSTQWNIPANIVPAGQMQVTAVVRVIARNDNTGQEVMDDSNALFTIRSSTPAPTLSVTVLSPNGGEQFQAGQQVTINWQSTGATNQRVQYSLNGVAFTPIVTGLAGNVQSTQWNIPANIVPAGQMQVTAVVRVIARNDNTGQEVMDDSNSLFTIRSSTPAPTLSVTVLSPNGGEQFQAGQQVTIQWQSTGATNQRVQYSLNGVTFTPIVTGLAGNLQSTQWNIPTNIVPAGQMQVTAVVRVIARNDNTGQEVMDDSNSLFTIRSSTPAPTLSVQVLSPNGGEQFQAGQQVTINWQSTGATNQRVQYSLNGVTFTPIVTGLAGNVQSTQWNIPANIVPAGQMQVTAVVRVIARNDNTGQEVMDDSNSLFTIRSSTPAPTLSVTVISPNGGEQFQAGQQVTINWQSTGATNQRVQYSLNGVTFTPIVTGLAGNVQSTQWNIPANIVPAGQRQVTAVVRVIARNDNTGQEVMDDSNNLFTIRSSTPAPTLSVQVLSPNGGETVTAGMPFQISWTSSGAASHRVQVSVNNGPFSIIADGLSSMTRSFLWTPDASLIPAGAPQAMAIVRVTAIAGSGQQAADDSNASFNLLRASAPGSSAGTEAIPDPGDIEPAVAGINDTKRIVAGRKATFHRMLVDAQPGTVVKLNVFELQPVPVGTKIEFPKRLVADQTGQAFHDIVVTTPIPTLAGSYDYQVDATFFINGIENNTDSKILRVIIKPPSVKIMPASQQMVPAQIVAGQPAQVMLLVTRTNYLGPITIFPLKPQGPSNLMVQLADIPMSDNEKGTDNVAVAVQSLAPIPTDNGTLPGMYSVEFNAMGVVPLGGSPLPFSFQVSIQPDVKIQFEPQTLSVDQGKSGRFLVTVFRYNVTQTTTPQISGLPPMSTSNLGPPMVTQVPPVGDVLVYPLDFTVPISNPIDLYPSEFTVSAAVMFAEKTASGQAMLTVPRPELAIDVMPNNSNMPVLTLTGGGLPSIFSVITMRTAFDDDVTFEVSTDEKTMDYLKVKDPVIKKGMTVGFFELDLPVDVDEYDTSIEINASARNKSINALMTVTVMLHIKPGTRQVTFTAGQQSGRTIGRNDMITLDVNVGSMNYPQPIGVDVRVFKGGQPVTGSPFRIQVLQGNPLPAMFTGIAKVVLRTDFSTEGGTYDIEVAPRDLPPSVFFTTARFTFDVVVTQLVLLADPIGMATGPEQRTPGDMADFGIEITRINVPDSQRLDLRIRDLREVPSDGLPTFTGETSTGVPHMSEVELDFVVADAVPKIYTFFVESALLPASICPPLPLMIEVLSPPAPPRRRVFLGKPVSDQPGNIVGEGNLSLSNGDQRPQMLLADETGSFE